MTIQLALPLLNGGGKLLQGEQMGESEETDSFLGVTKLLYRIEGRKGGRKKA